MSGPGDDELARLQREVAEAEAVIAELTRANAALAPRAPRARSVARDGGQIVETPVSLTRPAPSQVYRSHDPRVLAEDALAKANATVATLRIENSILLSQSAARTRRSVGVRLAFLAFTAMVGLVVLLWFVPGSARIFVFVAVMLALGGLLVHLIGAIPPRDGPPPPTPPLYPGL